MKSCAVALVLSSCIASTRASSCLPQQAGNFRRLKTRATCYDGTGTSFSHIRSADQCADKCTREGDMSSTLLLYGFDFDCDDDKCTCLYGTKWESGPTPNEHSSKSVACYALEPFPPAPPAPQPQCNTHDEPCESDSDCMQGGFNPCTKCGKSRGTRYYKRCYGGDEGGEGSEFLESGEPASSSDSVECSCILEPECCLDKAEEPRSFFLNTAEIALLSAQCNTYDKPCKRDSDCIQGGFNPCTKCGTQKGTRYYRRCYREGDENEELEFVQVMRRGLRGF